MSKNPKIAARMNAGLVEVKCKFDAEFRRFAVDPQTATRFEDFYKTIETVHRIQDTPFLLTYTDLHGDLLPINNDDNFHRAVVTAKPILRVFVQRKGECYLETIGYGTVDRKKKNPITKLIGGAEVKMRNNLAISLPEDFRRVSAIIDVDIIPETHRRVKLMKNGTDKPLGFYIRDGTSVRVTSHGLEKVPGIFISRLVPGGLAESTGLLAVNDEVLEVNGIEVAGKTLDQVTDMMVANSANLIITVKPVNQRNNIPSMRASSVRGSQKSTSAGSLQSGQSFDSDEINDIPEDDEDVVKDLTTPTETTKDMVDNLAAAAASTSISANNPTPPTSAGSSVPPVAMTTASSTRSSSSSGSARVAPPGSTPGDQQRAPSAGDADKDRDSAVVTL